MAALDEKFALGIEIEQRDIGLASLAATGTTLPGDIMTRIPEVDGVILGPVSHHDYPPRAEGGISPSAELRTSFELARGRRKEVTAVLKANAVKLSDGLFLRKVRKVAAEFPDVELEELIVDAAAAALIRRPSSFDVLVTTNMFGDILSDEASELSGSLGRDAPGLDRPPHRRRPRDRRSPSPAHHRRRDPRRPRGRTRDLGGTRDTTEFAEAVAKAIAQLSATEGTRP